MLNQARGARCAGREIWASRPSAAIQRRSAKGLRPANDVRNTVWPLIRTRRESSAAPRAGIEAGMVFVNTQNVHGDSSQSLRRRESLWYRARSAANIASKRRGTKTPASQHTTRPKMGSLRAASVSSKKIPTCRRCIFQTAGKITVVVSKLSLMGYY